MHDLMFATGAISMDERLHSTFHMILRPMSMPILPLMKLYFVVIKKIEGRKIGYSIMLFDLNMENRSDNNYQFRNDLTKPIINTRYLFNYIM